MAGMARGTASFRDGDQVVEREVDVRVTGSRLAPQYDGKLVGGRRAATDLAGRRVVCDMSALGFGAHPCVVNTDGRLHFVAEPATADE
jgi:hypothetical protein